MQVQVKEFPPKNEFKVELCTVEYAEIAAASTGRADEEAITAVAAAVAKSAETASI